MTEQKQRLRANPSTFAGHTLREAEMHATVVMGFAKGLGATDVEVMRGGRIAYSKMLEALGSPMPRDITRG
jgi:hypothetical protein